MTTLEIKLFHAEKRTELFEQLRIALEENTKELIKENNLPATDENAIFVKYQIAISDRILFEYTNYLAKKIPNFEVFTESISKDMFTDGVNLAGIAELYKCTLDMTDTGYLSIEDFTESKPDALAPLRQVIDIETFLGSLDDIVISSQELRLEFVNITQSVIDAINTFHKIADMDYSFKAKQFVIMTSRILAKYAAYKERIEWLGLGMLEEENHIDTVLANTLERYNYNELFEQLEKENVIVKRKYQ